MLKVNELIALQLVLEYIPLESLIAAASETFHNSNKDFENTCLKALETFLK